jgi:hypothetical protein
VAAGYFPRFVPTLLKTQFIDLKLQAKEHKLNLCAKYYLSVKKFNCLKFNP